MAQISLVIISADKILPFDRSRNFRGLKGRIKMPVIISKTLHELQDSDISKDDGELRT